MALSLVAIHRRRARGGAGEGRVAPSVGQGARGAVIADNVELDLTVNVGEGSSVVQAPGPTRSSAEKDCLNGTANVLIGTHGAGAEVRHDAALNSSSQPREIRQVGQQGAASLGPVGQHERHGTAASIDVDIGTQSNLGLAGGPPGPGGVSAAGSSRGRSNATGSGRWTRRRQAGEVGGNGEEAVAGPSHKARVQHGHGLQKAARQALVTTCNGDGAVADRVKGTPLVVEVPQDDVVASGVADEGSATLGVHEPVQDAEERTRREGFVTAGVGGLKKAAGVNFQPGTKKREREVAAPEVDQVFTGQPCRGRLVDMEASKGGCRAVAEVSHVHGVHRPIAQQVIDGAHTAVAGRLRLEVDARSRVEGQRALQLRPAELEATKLFEGQRRGRREGTGDGASRGADRVGSHRGRSSPCGEGDSRFHIHGLGRHRQEGVNVGVHLHGRWRRGVTATAATAAAGVTARKAGIATTSRRA